MRTRRFLCMSVILLCVGGCDTPKVSHEDKTPPVFAQPAFTITPTHRLTISLDTTFPEKRADGSLLRANYETVARDVLEVVEARFSGATLYDVRPIVCHVGSDPVPITNVTYDPSIIRIGIAMPPDDLNDLDYNRFAYQLSHELGHVMLGARRTNGLIETLAAAISYQALTDLSELWVRNTTTTHYGSNTPHISSNIVVEQSRNT